MSFRISGASSVPLDDLSCPLIIMLKIDGPFYVLQSVLGERQGCLSQQTGLRLNETDSDSRGQVAQSKICESCSRLQTRVIHAFIADDAP